MPKKIVSFTLSENSIKKLDQISNALGMSRSELLEFLVDKGFHLPHDVVDTLDEISKLQEKAKAKIKSRRR